MVEEFRGESGDEPLEKGIMSFGIIFGIVCGIVYGHEKSSAGATGFGMFQPECIGVKSIFRRNPFVNPAMQHADQGVFPFPLSFPRLRATDGDGKAVRGSWAGRGQAKAGLASPALAVHGERQPGNPVFPAP